MEGQGCSIVRNVDVSIGKPTAIIKWFKAGPDDCAQNAVIVNGYVLKQKYVIQGLTYTDEAWIAVPIGEE